MDALALKNVEKVNIPRCYFVNGNSLNSKVQLHLFMDASENTYAVVAYFLIESPGGIEISFVSSKTKVAPLRPVSIPRMGLLAAILGSRLSKNIVNSHDIRIDSA